jgi:hypothetical protein
MMINGLPRCQMLSLTCDNASNNDTLVEELAELVDEFPGAAAQTRCFAHITNLSAKSFLHSFDSPKSSEDGGEAAADGLVDDDEVVVPSDEGWVDEVEALTEGERETLSGEVEPVRQVLKKVSTI